MISRYKSEISISIFVFANLLTYTVTSLLQYSSLINIISVSIALFFCREYIICLIPYIIYSPIQIHADLPIYSGLMILTCIRSLINIRNLQRNELIILFLYSFVLLSLLLSVTNSSVASLFDKHTLSYFKGMIVILAIFYVQRNRFLTEKLLLSMVYAAGLAIIYKFLYLENPTIINSFTHLNEDDIKGLTELYYDGDYVPRLLYVGLEPNYGSAELIIALIVAIMIIRGNIVNLNFGRYAMISISLFSIYIQIIGSYSRSGFIFSTLVLALSVRIKPLYILFIFFALSLVSLYISTNESLANRLLSIGDDKTGTNRTDYWSAAVDMWTNSPLFGNGFGSYVFKIGDAAHSTYLEIAAEQGFFGILAFILFFLGFGFFLRTSRNSNSRLAPIYFGGAAFIFMLQTVSFYQIEILIFYISIFRLLIKSVNSYEYS